MGTFRKGKFFLLLVISCAVFVRGDAIPIEGEDGRVDFSEGFGDVCCQDRVLVQKLEEIVRDLSEVVSRLESKVREIDGVATVAGNSGSYDKPGSESYGVSVREGSDREGDRDENVIEEVVGGGIHEDKVRDWGGDVARGVSVTKFSPFWSEKFRFASAMRLDYEVTCINVLPYRDSEGLSKYVAIADVAGRFYVISRNGDVLVGNDVTLGSPVTAMVSYISVFKNESIVVTGHEDGELLMHKVWEVSSGEEWSTMSMKSIGKFAKGGGGSEGGAAVNILEVHHVGRTRYILSTDSTGRIRVFREDGSLYGSFMPSSRLLAFVKQRLMFLTETGAGSLDLRSMKLKESECEGLNQSVARTYVFDATERSKAYGYTSDGDLVHVVVLGDVGNFKCRVRFKKKLDVEEPVAFQAIKGYLLIVNSEKVFLYNVSTQHYARVGTPRQIFSASLDEIRSSFLNHHRPLSSDSKQVKAAMPLVASDREKLVVLGLGHGFLGMYLSNLPIYKSESNTMLWTSPVLFFVLFLFVAWQFFTKKKETLTSWGPDDPFTSASAISNPPNAGDRSLVDSSSRNNDVVDLRGTGLRPPPRRYGSPTRYPASTTTTAFRTGTAADHTSRPTADSNFRTSSELKYRGAPLEPPGFPKRREGIFASHQTADDSDR